MKRSRTPMQNRSLSLTREFMGGPLAAVLLGSVLACSSCTRQHPPNVLFVVIDTLRADRVGVYGNDRGLTPFLDSLATQGVVFANAYAASSWTNPSVASLFTSRYPTQHRVGTHESVLVSSEVTLAERLKEADYQLGGFVANIRLAEKFGFAQGFDVWRTFLARNPRLGRKPRAERVRVPALEWLDQGLAKQGGQPHMLYLHFMEPHPPFHPPDRLRERFQRDPDGPGTKIEQASANDKLTGLDFAGLSIEEIELLESLYDAEVAAVDEELRVIFAELRKRGFLDNAVIVITSDHGTEFKEHGFFLHGFQLYNESIKIPLLLLAPGIEGGRVVEENVSLVDVAPTLLDLLGQRAEPRFEGRSLVHLLNDSATATGSTPDVVSQLLDKELPFEARGHKDCLIRRSTKLAIQPDGTPQLFDLATDPGERTPNPSSLSEKLESLTAALYETNAGLAARRNPAHEVQPLGEEMKERLRALGYRESRPNGATP